LQTFSNKDLSVEEALVVDGQFDSILKNGWRQGSIASQELVLAAKLPIEEQIRQYYLVASHSCDLTNPKSDLEPKVELVRADVTTAAERESISARSPRKLALTARNAINTEICLLAQIETRQFADRNLFIAQRPDPDLRLSDQSVKMLAIWMSRRYRRPELPTELVNRLGKNKYDKFKELGRKNRILFSRILISLSSWEELENDQKYRVKILALLPSGEMIPEPAKQWAAKVDLLFSDGPEGVEAELTQVELESDVAISILQEFRPVDFDFLSFAAGEFDLAGDD
jgi:hypothetical protein